MASSKSTIQHCRRLKSKHHWNLLPQIGIKLIQENSKEEQMCRIHKNENSDPHSKQGLRKHFPIIYVRNEKTKYHVMRNKDFEIVNPIPEKGRWISLHLQE